jgi:DNA (cytosine-5)-methyltransferase 1
MKTSQITQHYSQVGNAIVRNVFSGSELIGTTSLSIPSGYKGNLELDALFDQLWLSAKVEPENAPARRVINVVDLFAGFGGLSIGIHEAAAALGMTATSKLAVDFDSDALQVFGANFPTAKLLAMPVEELIDGRLGEKPTEAESAILNELGQVDILIGGPPCQGHSALNNHTRHEDSRNELYLRMARFCELFSPDHVIIENVPGVIKDRSQVAQRTWEYLEKLGYVVDSMTIDVSRLGVAQKRKRNVTVASKTVLVELAKWYDRAEVAVRPLSWAISDLENKYDFNSVFDSAPKPSATNQKRMDYLFENNIFDLPNSQRPDCHRLKDHSYNSVYGRMFWNKPSQTITTGFGGMGRGRYVHPSQRRTLTPHEAARIQFIPDYFKIPTTKRTLMQKVIGNAVPSKLGFVIGLNLFGAVKK